MTTLERRQQQILLGGDRTLAASGAMFERTVNAAADVADVSGELIAQSGARRVNRG